MLKHLMSGSSLIALALHASDDGAAAKQALREKIAGNAKIEAVSDIEKEAKDAKDSDDKSDNKDDNTEQDDEIDDEDEEGEEEGEEANDKVEETAEEKAEREKQEKITAKAKRKDERMQARINEATRLKNEAIAEVNRLKAQLKADPDKTLTEEEVQSRAEAIAVKKLQEKNLEKLQEDFDNDCEKLRKEAKVQDKAFDAKIADIAEQFGPIPSFMIGVLSDLKNGGEVLAYIANDDDEAERIWDLKTKPAKMTHELVLISQKLAKAKEPTRRQISKVQAIDPVRNNGGSSQSTVITEADTKNMSNYVQKRIAQREAQKKARGY